MPTRAVAIHGDFKVGCTDASHSLTTPGQARSRAEANRMRPNSRMIARVALKMASAIPSDTMVSTALLVVAFRKYVIGAGSVVTLARLGAPRSTAVVGISSAATVITSDHRMATAIR